MTSGVRSGFPSNYNSNCFSTFSCLFPPSSPVQWRKPQRGPLGCPEMEKNNKTDYFHAWVSGACITVSSAVFRLWLWQLDLKWSRLEATARSCGFPLTLMPEVMPQEPCNIICFPCHLILHANAFCMPIYTNRFYFSPSLLQQRSVSRRGAHLCKLNGKTACYRTIC